MFLSFFKGRAISPASASPPHPPRGTTGKERGRKGGDESGTRRTPPWSASWRLHDWQQKWLRRGGRGGGREEEELVSSPRSGMDSELVGRPSGAKGCVASLTDTTRMAAVR